MAGSVNKVIIVGNLGTDPEVRTLTSGTKVAKLNIATSETYTNKEGQKVTNTEWHKVNVWRGLADIAERYLTKGSSVYVEGKLRTRSYDDKDGVTRYVTEIEGDNMTMLGGRSDSSPAAVPAAAPAAAAPSTPQTSSSQPATPPVADVEDDDLPF